MKNFIKFICISTLLLATLFFSYNTFAVRKFDINPIIPSNIIPEDVSGYWSSYSLQGLNVVLVSGKYYANGFGLQTCGKTLKATVSIPRTFPVNAWIYAEGSVYDPTNTGITYGRTLNLMSKTGFAGTFSVVAYDSYNNTLTVQLNTPAGGPSGTFILNRDPLTPYTALIVTNCP